MKICIPVFAQMRIIATWTRIVAIEISGEKFQYLRYIAEVDTKELAERLMDLMKDGESKGGLNFLSCLLEQMLMALTKMKAIG